MELSNSNFDYTFNNTGHFSRTKYVIYCVENTISHKFYIGQTSQELKDRWGTYKTDLIKPPNSERKTGSNIKLRNSFQYHYSLEGNGDFLKFYIIEIVDMNYLATDLKKPQKEEKIKIQKKMDKQEIYWIAEYRKIYGKENIFNIQDGGQGKPHKKHKHKSFKNSGQFKKGVIPYNKGKPHLRGISNGNATTYLLNNNPLISPAGEEFDKIECLTTFATKYDIDFRNLYAVLHHDRKTHKGWKLKNTDLKRKPKKIYYFYKNPLISPTGEATTKIEYIKEFCEENNLKVDVMQMVFRGEVINHRGWHLKEKRNKTRE